MIERPLNQKVAGLSLWNKLTTSELGTVSLLGRRVVNKININT